MTETLSQIPSPSNLDCSGWIWSPWVVSQRLTSLAFFVPSVQDALPFSLACSFKKICLLFIHLCVFLRVCTQKHTHTHEGQKRAVRSLRAGITLSNKLPNVGSENQTQLLWTSRKCFYMLSHFSKPLSALILPSKAAQLASSLESRRRLVCLLCSELQAEPCCRSHPVIQIDDCAFLSHICGDAVDFSERQQICLLSTEISSMHHHALLSYVASEEATFAWLAL